MALFSFRTRRAERDRETDAHRFGRLSRLLGELRAEMEAEKTGLENRHRGDAAEAGPSPGPAEAAAGYGRRIASLENEIALVGVLLENVNAFAAANGIESKQLPGAEHGAD